MATRSTSRWVQGVVLFGMLLGLAMAPAVGCITGATCAGGYINKAGECEPQCGRCVDGNVCFENACTLGCIDHQDCITGTLCTPATTDAGVDTSLCLPGKQRPPSVDPATNAQPGGYGWPCPFGTESCECPLGAENCATQPSACPNGLECDANACASCAPDDDVCEGDPLCNVGRCSDGTPCTFNTCDISECKTFACIGAGEGDAQAYCTQYDCESDEACPVGYYCGSTRDPHDICGNTCNAGVCSHDANLTCQSDGQCQKGNNARCGQTDEPCVDITASNASGISYFESGICLMRRACLVRDVCTMCNETKDCGAGDGDVCATHAGQDVCVRLCNSAGDCRTDETCGPYVSAGADSGKTGGDGTCSTNVTVDCVTADDCPGADETCEPRMACTPTAGRCDASDSASKFCRHCVDDTDCGGPDKPGSWACTEISGENVCVDLSFGTPCKKDADCPIAPSGRHGECLDEDDGVNSANNVYETCYVPYCDPSDPVDPCTDPQRADRFTCN